MKDWRFLYLANFLKVGTFRFPYEHFAYSALTERSVLDLCFMIGEAVDRTALSKLNSAFRRAWPRFHRDVSQFNEKMERRLQFEELRAAPSKAEPFLLRDGGDTRPTVAGVYLQHAIEVESDIERMLHYASLWSMGVPSDGSERFHYLPMSIYFSAQHDSSQEESILHLLSEFLEAWELEILVQLPTQQGSWFKNFWIRIKRVLTSDKASKLMEEVEFGIKQATLEATQADIDLKRAQGFEAIMRGLGADEQAMVRLGSTLVVKKPGAGVYVTTLTPPQMMEIRAQPGLAELHTSVLAALLSPSTPKMLNGVNADPDLDKDKAPGGD